MSTWLNILNPIRSVFKPSMGNHEIADDSQSDRDLMASTFGVPNSNWIYSFNHQYVHCLMLNTEQSASSQTAFINSDLAAARADPSIKWIIVCFHRQIYTSPSNHSAQTGYRSAWHPLFDQYKVDLVLSAHNHNYQRSYPLKYNSSSPDSPLVQSTSPNNYVKNAGTVFVCAGTMGQGLYSLGSKPSWQAIQTSSIWGFFNLEFRDAGNTLICTQYNINGGAVFDQFTINIPTPALLSYGSGERISLSF